MKRKIRFSYEGKNYEVPMEAYELNAIMLPDGRVLVAGGWLESMPPKPIDLHEMETHRRAKAILATEVA